MAEGVGVYFEDHRESKDLGRLALRGGIVSVAMQYGNGVLQIVAAIVLARLLAPEDFGLVAIVTVLTSFAPLLIDFGLGDATTQRAKITPSQVSSLFWLSSGIGLAIAVVVAACSPLIAAIYREPRLEPIALYSAITFVLWGVSNQHLALHDEQCNLTELPKYFSALWQELPLPSLSHFAVMVSGAASDCELALRCFRSVASMPMEAWISRL